MCIAALTLLDVGCNRTSNVLLAIICCGLDRPGLAIITLFNNHRCPLLPIMYIPRTYDIAGVTVKVPDADI